MSLRKAAEDLLEGVEAAIKAGDWKVDGACDPDSAIEALRQALAQPEQEPVAWVYRGNFHPFDPSDWTKGETATPLYTAPPKREWVGLTKDEVDSWELPDSPTVFEFAKYIEAKLKEKNG